MRYCLMHNNDFYNLFPEALSGCLIAEAGLGGVLFTYFNEDEAEGAKFSAYARITEYMEAQKEVPELVYLIPDLEVVSVDEVLKELMDDLGIDEVKAYD